MPDWQEFVRQRLAGLELDSAEKEEVQTELAAHLEESYEIFRKQGLRKEEAVCRTLDQVSDWQELRSKISAARRREDPMNKRLQQLWIPGFLTLILSTVLLMTLQEAFGVKPLIVSSGPSAILFYLPWLVSLPFIGALGAYLSSRAGGSRRTVLLASMFPAVALATAFLLMFPIGMIVEWVTRNDLSFKIVAITLLSNWIGWIVVPGAALLAGGLVAHVFLNRGSSSQSTQVGSTTHA